MSDRAKLLLLAVLMGGVVLVGCRIEWLNPEETVRDLVVIHTSPGDRQTNVSQTATVIIRTSVPLDPEYVIPNQAEPWKNSQVILVDSTNAVLPSAYSFNGELLTLTPLAPFGLNTTYGVAVRPGTRDIYGKNIKTPYAFTFSTGGALSAIPNWPPFPLPGAGTAPPATPGTFTLTGQTSVARCLHEAVALNDGRVLICGGSATPGSTPFRSAEIYDPVTQTWALSQSNQGNGMFFIRVRHTALKLHNGHVLVIGGTDNTTTWDTCEEYDPNTDTFGLHSNPMQSPRYWHTAVLLANGNVLAHGGVGQGVLLNTMEILDMQTGNWVLCQPTMGGTIGSNAVLVGRYAHETVTLPDGGILSTGGYYAIVHRSCDLYWPSVPGDGTAGNAQFTGTHLTTPRDQHTATVLTTGRGQGIVIVIGGERDDFIFSPIAVNTAEVYDHSQFVANPVFNANQGAWSPMGSAMTEKRCDHTSTLLASGKILVVAGCNAVGTAPSRTAEMFDPFGLGNNVNMPWAGIDLTGKFDWTRDPQGNQTVLPNLLSGIGWHSATTLRDGRVLIACGDDFHPLIGLFPVSLCWLYNP
ncbi:MAG: Ig-like domain-containing protein [Planctomycetota bacterium]|jgi:hypothetical protein